MVIIINKKVIFGEESVQEKIGERSFHFSNFQKRKNNKKAEIKLITEVIVFLL